MEQIFDATGKGYGVKVDLHNRLHVDSVSTQREDYASLKGESFNINTGLITLTNAAKNAVLYIKNNENYDLLISSLFYQTGASTGGSGNIYVDVVRNPTTGTIITGATPVEMNENRNFGSSYALNVTAYKGGTGLTFTNGTKFIESILATTTQRIPVDVGTIVLPRGASLGINITTPIGNTSMVVEFALACYLETEEGQ